MGPEGRGECFQHGGIAGASEAGGELLGDDSGGEHPKGFGQKRQDPFWPCLNLFETEYRLAFLAFFSELSQKMFPDLLHQTTSDKVSALTLR